MRGRDEADHHRQELKLKIRLKPMNSFRAGLLLVEHHSMHSMACGITSNKLWILDSMLSMHSVMCNISNRQI